MTKEDLWLKDLCARIPYHPKGLVVNACTGAECEEWLTCATFTMFTSVTNNCRLYLRPMLSMTEEEVKELYKLLFRVERIGFPDIYKEEQNAISSLYDWLNAHHFDYRGLIPKGLAIEVTVTNNPYKE